MAEAAVLDRRTLLLFVHGFGDSAAKTWAQFASLVERDPELSSQVDVRYFEFPTGYWLLSGFKRKPRVQLLADALHTEVDVVHDQYEHIILVAHSLGGLIARRFLVDRLVATTDDADAAEPTLLRVDKLMLYAVPNDGAGLANLARHATFRDPQIRQLCKDSDFLEGLNREWDFLKVGSRLEIKYVVAARDNVVTDKSARGLQGVGASNIAVLAKEDHRSCVRPKSHEDVSYRVMKTFVLAPPPAPPPRTTSGLRQFKAVGFDLDGTLIRGLTFSWTRIWQDLGFKKSVYREAMKRYLRGECTYEEWTTWAVARYRERRLTKARLIELAAELELTHNFDIGIKTLRDAGYRLAIISGGIDTLLYAKIPKADELFDDVFINRLKFDAEGVVEGVEPTPYDFAGKADALKLVAQRAGSSLENAVFVGDAFNDAHVSRVAGLSIAYPPQDQQVDALTDIQVDDDDLTAVAEAILNAP